MSVRAAPDRELVGQQRTNVAAVQRRLRVRNDGAEAGRSASSAIAVTCIVFVFTARWSAPEYTREDDVGADPSIV
jgi:hypothetical protein